MNLLEFHSNAAIQRVRDEGGLIYQREGAGAVCFLTCMFPPNPNGSWCGITISILPDGTAALRENWWGAKLAPPELGG